MIDGKIKEKLIEELAKDGNILHSCRRVNIVRSTFYRWMHNDRSFRKDAKRAMREGRDNACDIVEYALLKAAKDGKVEAMKYFLSRNSDRYKPGKNQVLIVHSSPDKEKYERLSAEAQDMINQASEIMREHGEGIRKLAIERMEFYKEKGLDPNSAIYVSEEEFMKQMQDDANNPTQPQSHP